MTITKTLKRAGTTLGLVGLLAFNEGCATAEGNAVGSAFLGIISTPSVRDTDFDKIGKFGAGLGSVYSGAAAQRQFNEAGAPRVNVNVNTNAPNYVPQVQQDYIILKDYCKINGQSFIEGHITKIYSDNLWINSQGKSYNLQLKDVERVFDN